MSGKKIFISYSRSDIDYVKSLVDALRQQGFEVWFDKNIVTGNDWDDTIEEEIKKADALVLILSKTSVASDAVKDEMSYAMSLGKSVNPIKIEECDVPMRLARKQFIDFAVLGHEVGFERLVKDITLQLNDTKKVNVPRGTFVPPKQQQHYVPPVKPKSNNNLMIIGGIVMGVALMVIFIIVLVYVFSPSPDYSDTTGGDTENYITDYDETYGATAEDQDWTATYSKNNLDSYINFLYTYGKTTKYYKDAYREINRLLPRNATVWYGTKDGNYNFTKYLYYAGDQTTPPQYDDIITPLFKSELYMGENYERSGYFVQPGQKLLVYDVWVDVNNNIWVGVRYQ